MITTTYFNLDGDECVQVIFEDGTSWSGLKSAWEIFEAELKTKK